MSELNTAYRKAMDDLYEKLYEAVYYGPVYDVTFWPIRFRYVKYCWCTKNKRSLMQAIKFIIDPRWSPL